MVLEEFQDFVDFTNMDAKSVRSAINRTYRKGMPSSIKRPWTRVRWVSTVVGKDSGDHKILLGKFTIERSTFTVLVTN